MLGPIRKIYEAAPGLVTVLVLGVAIVGMQGAAGSAARTAEAGNTPEPTEEIGQLVLRKGGAELQLTLGRALDRAAGELCIRASGLSRPADGGSF
jgi:hypothetical protein